MSAEVILDMPEATYHADPIPGGSLSVSWAKKLLAPGGPAKFRWEWDHRDQRPASDALDFGKVAHAIVLGEGAQFEVLPGDDLRKKETADADRAARSEGRTPIKPKDMATIHAMAEALAAHHLARELLAGSPEVSLFAPDEPSGVMRRGRTDVLREREIVDYKTARDANPATFARVAADLRYDMQAAWYIDLAQACDLDVDRFFFVAQEKAPPYLVSVTELDADFLEIGRRANRRAIDLFAECTASGDWPGYAPVTHTLAPPPWLLRDLDRTLDPQLESELLALIGDPS